MSGLDTRHWRAVINSVRRRSDVPCVKSLLREVCDELGLRNAVYHASSLRSLTNSAPYLKLTYSDEWVSEYISENYFNIDPVVQFRHDGRTGFSWDDLNWEGEIRSRFRETSIEAGVGRTGASIPIQGRAGDAALFSVSSDMTDVEWRMFLYESMPLIRNLGLAIHDKVLDVEGLSSDATMRSLSGREIDVLRLCAQGWTGTMIAKELGITERTVRAYVESAREKLDASNRMHAVCRAIGKGIIEPPE